MTSNNESRKPIAVKICGITRLDQAIEIATLGANAIGVIGVERTPRFVDESRRREIFSKLSQYSAHVERVWVIANMLESQIKLGLGGKGTPSLKKI